MNKPDFRRKALQHLSALGLYSLLLLVASFPLILHFNSALIGDELTTDRYFHYWNAWYFRQGMQHGLVHFWNDLQYQPIGFNMLFTNHAMLHSFVAWALAPVFGFIGALNFSVLGSVVLGAYASFVLAQSLECDYSSSLLAGFIVGFNHYVISQIEATYEYMAFWPLLFFIWRFDKALRSPSLRNEWLAAFFLALNWFTIPSYIFYGVIFAVVLTMEPYVSFDVRHLPADSRARKIILWTSFALALTSVYFVIRSLSPELIGMKHGGFREAARFALPFWVLFASGVIWFFCLLQKIPTARFDFSFPLARLRPLASTVFWSGLFLLPFAVALVKLVLGGVNIESPMKWKAGGVYTDLLDLLYPNLSQPLIKMWIRHTEFFKYRWQLLSLGWAIPALLWIGLRREKTANVRRWLICGVVSVVCFMGPRLTIGGIQTYVPLPFYFVLLLPFGSNLTSAWRFAITNFFFFGIVIALIATAQNDLIKLGKWRFRFRTLAWALVAFEFCFWIPRPIDHLQLSPLYQRFQKLPPGNTLDVPFLVQFRYGSSPFSNYFEDFLLRQTIHEHATVGGFAGRTPFALFDLYRKNPFLLDLTAAEKGKAIGRFISQPEMLKQAFHQWHIEYVLVQSKKIPVELNKIIGEKWPVEEIDRQDGIVLYRAKRSLFSAS